MSGVLDLLLVGLRMAFCSMANAAGEPVVGLNCSKESSWSWYTRLGKTMPWLPSCDGGRWSMGCALRCCRRFFEMPWSGDVLGRVLKRGEQWKGWVGSFRAGGSGDK